MNMELWYNCLFWLLVAHAVCDYPLQGDFLARAKNRHDPINGGERFWPWALGAHSAIHAGAVTLVTGSVILGCVEFVLHAIIDAAKCEKLTTFNVDQFLHVACKVGYVAFIFWL